MRTGSSDTLLRGQRGRSHREARHKKARQGRYGRIDLESLESRTLLSTTPAATATGQAQNLSGLSSVTASGNANSPTVVIDPYDSNKLFAVWGVDLSSLTTVPHTTAIVEGAYSNNAGASWSPLGTSVADAKLDVATINATPPTNYTQVTSPSLGFDGQGNVYVLSLQTTGASDGALVLNKFNFAGNSPSEVFLPNGGIVYQWVTGADAATSPVVAVDASNPALTGIPNPHANNVYIAWASIDTEPANPNPFAGTGYNANRAELIVGTPVSSPSGNQASLAFSGVTTVNVGGNFGPQHDSHPQLVINQNNGGQITVGWDDFGSGATASPPTDSLMASLVAPGDSYGFDGGTGLIKPGISVSSSSTQGNWAAAKIYNAGPDPTIAEDPTSIFVGDVNGDLVNDIVVSDSAPNNSINSGIGVLLNLGAGVFPAAGVTANGIFRAGPNPSSVVLGDFVAGHSKSTILDAAVANNNVPAGGVSILPNGTPPNDGLGLFGTPTSVNTTPAQQGTVALAENFFDGTSQLSLVAVNSASNSISLFPDGSSTNASFISTPGLSPIAVTSANFRGAGTLPDLAVLYSNGTIQFFVNTSSGPGNISFTAGQKLTGLNAVAIAAAPFGGGLPDLAVVNSSGVVEWLANTSTTGGAAVTFNAAPNVIGTVTGTPVGVAAGVLSTGGNYVGFQDLAVLYAAPGTHESTVAVYQNVNGVFVHTQPPGQIGDFDAGRKNPTAIALGNLTGNTALPWDDIIVTNNDGRGSISVLQPAALPTTAVTNPGFSTYNNTVTVPNESAINNLTVAVELIDFQSVSNLQIELVAPDLSKITLVRNQINNVGTAVTSQGLQGGNAIGWFGFTTGTPGTPGIGVGTIFDDNATRNIFDATTAGINGNTSPDYIGYFRPELGSLKNFIASLNGNINGTWQLQITNFSSTAPASGSLRQFSLQFSTGMNAGAPATIATTNVTGAIGNTFARAVPSTPNGAGPGLVLAIDNSLGPNSPFAGRVYAAYVGYQAFTDINQHANPSTNTDIFLSYFDTGTQRWVARGVVNDDNSNVDGFSGADRGNGTFGRTQFQPAITVDQASGTLVVSWRDARDDAANARVATYITTSIDGGNSFSPQTFANTANTAVDAITGQTDILGPKADNQSAGNPQRDAGFGYGNQMGLVAFNGQLYPVWAGNFNQGFNNNGVVAALPLNIFYRPMVIAAGPRIINSSMGPISLAEATSGSVAISVTFDRPINPATFVPGDVQVFFHDTTKNSDPFVALGGISITPAGGNTQFTIHFNPLPAGANPATHDYTGTYSYLIAPDAGAGTPVISSTVWAYVNGALRKFDPMDQNADGTADENALTSAFTGQSPGDVYAVPTPQFPPGTALTFNGAPSILRPAFGFDPTTLPLIVPGPQILSTSVPGGNSGLGNLINNGTTSTFNVNFDRPISVSSFTPDQVLQIMGPAGAVSGPHFFPSDVRTGQPIASASTTKSTLTIPSFGGSFRIADIAVSLTAAFSPDSGLTAVLIAPNGAQVPLFSGVGANGSSFINTVLDDAGETSITTGTAPFTGTYRPTGLLSSLDGAPVDFENAFGVWVPGVWTLQLTTAAGASGVLDNWSLSITPQISVAPVAGSLSQNGTAATAFQIGFPLQQLSGTYTIQLGPIISDTFGDALDTNQNAGVAVLRNTGQNSPTVPVQYNAADLPKTIPAPVQGADATVSSTITVPDNFFIQGDATTADVSGLRVQIKLTYPVDPDLSATLYHYDSNGDLLGSVPLFMNVGSGFATANFTNTIFDDNATTAIADGASPFAATFSPQQSLATAFAGASAQGTWTLVIQNAGSGSGSTGTFSNWSLLFQKPVPTSGLGEPGTDVFSGSYRIFTLSQVAGLSSQAWTAVGPAAIGSGNGGSSAAGRSGRVSGLAVDPSDPSGNTVFAGGASGGIWKTTNFLTTASSGPTWIPLTDFGPTSGVNIGGIAIFPRNNDPNQSIVVAATGEGDTGTPGVGFLVSQDGGSTWVLDDSTTNVDASGNELPIESTARNRTFVGDSAFQVVIDPKATLSGGVIIYAALSGPTGGVWRSLDTGATWQLMLSGQATSVVLDAASGAVVSPTTHTFVQGNLQVVYAALRGTGVYMSPNQGQVWNQLLGNIGNPLIFNNLTAPPPNVNPINGPNPNGAQGRIQLAVPAATGNHAQDAVYTGWLYAIVATPAGALDGVFVTKDFGQNWTMVRIPTEPNEGYQSNPAIPTNDVGLADYSVIGSTRFPQGNYNIAIAVSPTDPSVLYVGGTSDGNQSALIRIDLTAIWDAHNLDDFGYNANDGGLLTLAAVAPTKLSDLTKFISPGPYLNFIRSPQDPFNANASLYVNNYASFTNNGAGVEWIPFDVGGTDYHRMITMVDPLTGLSRLIAGNDQGIWSVLDNDGTFENQIGSSYTLANTDRNGNLQITQFYYGAAQPSNAAALIAGSLFYGSAQDDGGPRSGPGLINGGNIVWNGPGGDASGVATDQQGNGTLYQYWWPCCGGGNTDFFQVNGVGRTSGLLQASGGQPTPDPQWPFTGGPNFTVNPVNGQDIVISSNVGRIFTTTNQGVTWFDVGDPGVFNNPGNFSVALAYGAPDPGAPSGIGSTLGNFIYVGTARGQIFATQNGGGSGSGNNWLNISLGLDGSPVQSIITDPTRGNHDAYAVTSSGVFYLADSILLGNNAANAAFQWVNITANLKKLAYGIFGESYDPTTDTNSKSYLQPAVLSSIVADWRYAIPNSRANANGPTTHPVLYVSAGSSGGVGSGVYQSLDGGQSWTYFPDTAYGAVVEGGYLPHVAVTTLSLSLGNIDPNTGMPTLKGPNAPGASNRTSAFSADPDTLMAATYGQGAFAINLAPLIIGNTVTVSPTYPGTGNVSAPIVGGPITITGTSEITSFGNATWITIEDLTDPSNPRIIAGFNPANGIPAATASNSTNAKGGFTLALNPFTAFASTGMKTIEVFATDNAGSVGNKVIYTFNFDPATHLVFDANGEPPATALTGSNFASPTPVIVDALDEFGNIDPSFNSPVTLSVLNQATGLFGTVTVTAVNGVATFMDLEINADGTYKLVASSPGDPNAAIPALAPGTSTSIVIVGAAAKLYVVTQPQASVVAGAGFGLVIGADDVFGNPTPFFTGSVTLAILANPGGSTLGGTTTVTVSPQGVATFSGLTLNKVGMGYTLQATSATLTPVTTNAIRVTPAAATQLTILPAGEPPANVVAGQAFPMVVDAQDPFGNLDTNFGGSVTIALPSIITGTPTVTAHNGVATFSNLILDKVGTYQLQATSTGLVAVKSTSVTVAPDPHVAILAWTDEPPDQITHGGIFEGTIAVQDQFGNLETGFNGSVSMALHNNPGNAVLGGSTTVAFGGIADFPGLTIDVVGNGYTLRATAAGVTSPDSTPIDVTPIPPVALKVSTQPPVSTAVFQTFGLSIVITDQSGGPDPDFNGNVTVAIASGPPGSALGGGATTVTATAGMATFSGLTLSKVGSVTLRVSSSGLSSISTNAINVTAAAASKLVAVSEPPLTLKAGTTFGFEVKAEDQYGNLATSYNGTVTAALTTNAAGATLVGPADSVASGGLAFFSGLTVNLAGLGYTIQVGASDHSLTPLTTTSFNVTADSATHLGISQQPPGNLTAGVPFGLSVAVEDRFNNVVTTFAGPVTIALASNPPAGKLNGLLTRPVAGGHADFSSLALNTAGNGYTILASSTGLVSATSGEIDVAPAAATSMVLSIPVPDTMVAGFGFGLAVQALDPFGNLATSFTGTVTLALKNNPGVATLNGPLTVAAAGGIANSHDFYTITKAATGYTIVATSPGLPSVTSQSFNVTPRAATKLAVKTQPPTSVVGGQAFGFVVVARDQFDNVDTNFTGKVSVALPAGSQDTLGGTTQVTSVAGQATFAGLALSGPASPVSLLVSSGALTGTTTNPVAVTTGSQSQTTPQIQFANGSVSVNENAGSATLQLVRTGPTTEAVSVTVSTSGGTATPGVNYTPINQVVTFAAGQSSQPVTIPVKDAGILASPINVNVVLSSPSANAGLGSPATATLSILNVGQPTTNSSLVAVEHVQVIKNKKHQITKILVSFSGGVDASEAASIGEYSLVMAGKRNSFTAKNARKIKIRSAVYTAANDTVTLMLKKRLVIAKRLQLTVNGQAPAGLTDGAGRLIDGNHDGVPGGNAVAILKRNSATISAVTGVTSAVDSLLARGELGGLTKARKK